MLHDAREATLRRRHPTLRLNSLTAAADGAPKVSSLLMARPASPMHTLVDMVDPIRDHWVIALAVVLATALVVWLVATRRR